MLRGVGEDLDDDLGAVLATALLFGFRNNSSKKISYCCLQWCYQLLFDLFPRC
jgi:hypothetical protein